MNNQPLATVPSWCDFVCPFCKGPVDPGADTWACGACGAHFPRAQGVVDFRRRYPDGVYAPPGWDAWVHGQVEYEKWAVSKAEYDPSVLDEQRGMEPMYRRLLPLRGRVLDVAGGAGIVRDFLSAEDRYVSINPWLGAPVWLAKGMRGAHPRVGTPVPFVGGHAEWLPFAAGGFDWVHMRSCIDHFFDPFQALREAWRVLSPGGCVAVGVAALGGPRSAVLDEGPRGLAARAALKFRREGVRGVAKRAFERLRAPREHDEHLWHPSLDNLKLLISGAGFTVEEFKWLDPPGDYVVFIRGRKPAA